MYQHYIGWGGNGVSLFTLGRLSELLLFPGVRAALGDVKYLELLNRGSMVGIITQPNRSDVWDVVLQAEVVTATPNTGVLTANSSLIKVPDSGFSCVVMGDGVEFHYLSLTTEGSQSGIQQ